MAPALEREVLDVRISPVQGYPFKKTIHRVAIDASTGFKIFFV
jgi:hypothetical protein